MTAYLVYFVSASAITEQYHCGHFAPPPYYRATVRYFMHFFDIENGVKVSVTYNRFLGKSYHFPVQATFDVSPLKQQNS